MNKWTGCAALVFFAVAYAPCGALAGTIETASKVSSVTVFADRAAITRTGTVNLPAGAHTVTVTDLPAGFDEASLRVQGSATSAVKIGAVDIKRVYLSELAAAAEQEKAKALQAKRDEKALNDADIKALQTRIGFIEHLAFVSPPSIRGPVIMPDMEQGYFNSRRAPQQGVQSQPSLLPPQEPAPRSLDLMPDKWPLAWSSLQTGMSESQKALVAKNIAGRQIDEEIAKLEKEYNQIRTAKRERRNVIVHIESQNETEFNYSINYQTRGVSWKAIYDARLNTEKAELKLEQYGEVSQQTGEDWKGIEMVFSTARPEIGTEMPKLQEWYIHPIETRARLAKTMGLEVPGGSPPGAAIMQNDAFMEEIAAEKMAVPAAPEPMSLAVVGYTVEFRVPGRVDLVSVSEPSKFFVGSQTMKAEMNVQATPRLSELAFLFAKVTNKEKYPVLAGRVAKYRDGAFIGNAQMEMLRPDESADLSFGADDRITVSYQKTKHEQSNPALVYVGDMMAERQYRSKIKNLHKTPMRVTVFDQYPVAQDPDIKVKLLEDVTTKGFAKDKEDRQGVIIWTADFQPQEEKVFDIAFSVKFPKDKRLPEF